MFTFVRVLFVRANSALSILYYIYYMHAHDAQLEVVGPADRTGERNLPKLLQEQACLRLLWEGN